MSDVDVFAENYTLIDWEIHELWIKGLSVTEAVMVMRERGILNEYPGVTQDLLLSDLNDHFRLFSMLEHLLVTVGNFSEQLLYQLSSETQDLLIERYYSLDHSFCREILGKKLNSRLRKDLDETSERTGVHLKSCRRQFDNIKRIFKVVEDMPGDYVTNIRKHFNFSQDLAEKYAVIILITSFRVEMSKKKLNMLKFETIKSVCLRIIRDWMDSNENEPSLDKEFLVSLKELKMLLERDKEHRNIVVSRLQALPKLVSAKSCSEIESNFKTLSRNIIYMAQSLGSNRELKDFFVYTTEKIVEPLKQMQLERSEVEQFLKAYTEAVTDNVLLVEDNIKTILRKFMFTLTPCVLAIY